MIAKHLTIYPSGEMKWVALHRKRIFDDVCCGQYSYDLDDIYKVIGCDCVETVSLRIENIVILIDESGKVKSPPQVHNQLVSKLYGGYLWGDYIAGPAIFFRSVGSWLEPLLPSDEDFFSLLLGVELPNK